MWARLVGLAAVAGGGLGALCYHTEILNNPWCSSFRVVRFGRATNAVRDHPIGQLRSLITRSYAVQVFWVALDYKWSLHNVYWGTEAYNRTIVDVRPLQETYLCLQHACSRDM